MKSSLDTLRERGFVDRGNMNISNDDDIESITAQLISPIPTVRTISAIKIQQRSLVELIPNLIRALETENRLYTKIEISNALISFGEKSIHQLIPYLGKIGNNQHKKLPLKHFNKNSYPLPRDIVARILVNIKAQVINQIITADLSLGQLYEAVDVLGHISFNSKTDTALPFLLNCYNSNKYDKILTWKLLRSFSGFNSAQIKNILEDVIKYSHQKEFVWEAERSLRLIL